MRFIPILFLLLTAPPDQPVEVHTTNASVEITGCDCNRTEEVDGSPLKLRVPRASSLDVWTANGSIHVTGVSGTMRLRTSNGEISVEDAGAAEIHAHTSNGAINLEAPAGLNANLSAHTSNGRIHSDLEVESRRIGENLLEGKIGTGGPEIDLHTSNSAINLRRAGNQEKVNSVFTPGQVK